MTRPGPSTRVRVVEYDDGQSSRHEDRLATEEPLEIRLCWPGHAAERVVVTMRTPGADFELAAGFLFSEGLIDPHEHVETIAYCVDRALSEDQEYNVVTVDAAVAAVAEPEQPLRTDVRGLRGVRQADAGRPR